MENSAQSGTYLKIEIWPNKLKSIFVVLIVVIVIISSHPSCIKTRIDFSFLLIDDVRLYFRCVEYSVRVGFHSSNHLLIWYGIFPGPGSISLVKMLTIRPVFKFLKLQEQVHRFGLRAFAFS